MKKCDTDVTLSTVLTFLLTLILEAFFGILFVLGWKKYFGKPNFNKGSQTYEDTAAPDMSTEGNPSYSHNMLAESPVDNQNRAAQSQSDLSTKQRPSGPSPVYEDPDILH